MIARQLTLAGFATVLTLLTAQPSPAQSPCHPDDIGITVCPSGRVELRVIRGTASPNNRYGIAWDTDEGKTGRDYELQGGDDEKTRYAGGDSDTFLVRLTDGKSLLKLKGMHPGDARRYNHQTQDAEWSPDETWVVALNGSKWSTDNADAYRIGGDSVTGPLDLLPSCIAAERQYFKKAGRKINIDDYQQWLTVDSIRNDGNLIAICDMQIMKQDDEFRFIVDMKLGTTAKGLDVKVGAIRRCRGNEKKGLCADREP